MARVAPAYCDTTDIKLGDIQPPRGLDLAKEVADAADEMDAWIGELYELPLEIDEGRADHTRDRLLLKKINADRVAGRLIMQANAGGEDGSVHAYGKLLWDNAEKELARIAGGRTVLVAGVPREPTEDQQPNGPLVTNRDAASYVDSFYSSRGSAHLGPEYWGVTSNG